MRSNGRVYDFRFNFYFYFVNLITQNSSDSVAHLKYFEMHVQYVHITVIILYYCNSVKYCSNKIVIFLI